MKLTLIEDDHKLSEYLSAGLRNHGFHVSHFATKSDLEDLLRFPKATDIFVLDRLIGTKDTRDYLREIKSKYPKSPILILSAISTPEERTSLLNLGADDYLGKPFSMQELVARLKVLLRRNETASAQYLEIGNLILDLIKRSMQINGKQEVLTAKEFLLMRTLCQEPGRIWSKMDLLDGIWGQSAEVETNVVETTITNLRKKLAEAGSTVKIRNTRNAGYWIET